MLRSSPATVPPWASQNNGPESVADLGTGHAVSEEEGRERQADLTIPPVGPKHDTARDDRPSSSLAAKFLSELYTPAPPRIRRLSFLIAAEQWLGALIDQGTPRPDAPIAPAGKRAELHAYRMDREVDNFVGIGQVERLRRQLRFE